MRNAIANAVTNLRGAPDHCGWWWATDRVAEAPQVLGDGRARELELGAAWTSQSHLGNFIQDKNAILPINAAIQANLRETTTRVFASLTPREERVLRMRLGIGMNTDHTLEEVGDQALTCLTMPLGVLYPTYAYGGAEDWKRIRCGG